jgi:hypothetical protein
MFEKLTEGMSAKEVEDWAKTVGNNISQAK